MTRLIVLLVILLAPSWALASTIWYVSETASNGYVVGNDANDGLTPATAWLTVSKGIASSATGDEVYINDGTYAGLELGATGYALVAKGITLIAQNKGQVIFQPSAITAGVRFQGPAGVTQGLTGIVVDGVNGTVPNYDVFIEDAAGIYTVNLIDCTFNNAILYTIFQTANEINLYIKNIVFTATSVNSTRAFLHNLVMAQGSVVIDNVSGTLAKQATSGIGLILVKSTVAGVTADIQHVTATVTLDGSLVGAGEHPGIVVTNIANAVIANNAVTVNGQVGSRTSVLYRITADAAVSAINGVIRDNTGTNNTTGGYLAHCGSDGPTAGDNQTNGCSILTNTLIGASNTIQHGLMLGFTQGGIVRGNVISNCGICLLSKEQTVATTPAQFVSNVVINPLAQAFRAKGSDQTEFNNNTAYWSGTGPTYCMQANQNDAAPSHISTAIVFKNNICEALGGLTTFAKVDNDTSTASFLNNNYYTDQALGANAWVYNATSYATLALWEATSTATNEKSTNPLFVSAGTDFHLTAASPLRRIGVAWTGCVDLTNTACPSPPQIGAYIGPAQTWYVRPIAGSYGAEDGLAYATAFKGFAGIHWSTLGVVSGDTLYVCGAHTEMLQVLSDGVSGSPIVISGACPGDPDTIDTHGQVGHIDGIQIIDHEWITLKYHTILGATRYGMVAYVSALSNMNGIVMDHNTVANLLATDLTNVCHGIAFDGVVGAGKTHSNGAVTNNTVTGTSSTCGGQDNNDPINVSFVTGTFTVANNDVSYGHDGLDISSGSGSGMLIYGNKAHHNRFAGIKIHGGTVCPVGLIAAGNLVYENTAWGIIFQDVQNSFLVNNTIIGNGTFGGLEIEQHNACTQSGNSYLNNIIAEDYVNGIVRIYTDTKAQFEAANTWNGNVIWQTGAQTQLIRFNVDNGNSISEGATFTTWVVSHAKDLNVDPAASLVNLVSDFRLRGGTALQRVGAPTTKCRDVRGYVCASLPDIGAYQVTGGSPAASRSAITQSRALRQ